jgi:activating signal cointegrator complex subunit 1
LCTIHVFTILFAEEMSYEDEMCDAIEETNGGFRAVMDVPSPLFKFIIGRKGETKRKIEMETESKIIIPNQGQTGNIGRVNIVHF